MKAVQPAAKRGRSGLVQIEIQKRKEEVLTQGLENLAWFFKFDVEIPASAEGTDR